MNRIQKSLLSLFIGGLIIMSFFGGRITVAPIVQTKYVTETQTIATATERYTSQIMCIQYPQLSGEIPCALIDIISNAIITKTVTLTTSSKVINLTQETFLTRDFAINATFQTIDENFTIGGLPYYIPNGTIFQVTNFHSPSSHGYGCDITIHLISYDRTQDSASLYAYPQWFTIFETPCNSNGAFTYHLFHDAKVVALGTVKQVRP